MNKNRTSSIVQFVLFSFIGVFMFFAQITVGDSHGIPIDILTNAIISGLGPAANYLALLLVVLGRGASEISSTFGLNQSFSDILTGIILFFIIGSEFFITYQVSLRKSGKKEA